MFPLRIDDGCAAVRAECRWEVASEARLDSPGAPGRIRPRKAFLAPTNANGWSRGSVRFHRPARFGISVGLGVAIWAASQLVPWASQSAYENGVSSRADYYPWGMRLRVDPPGTSLDETWHWFAVPRTMDDFAPEEVPAPRKDSPYLASQTFRPPGVPSGSHVNVTVSIPRIGWRTTDAVKGLLLYDVAATSGLPFINLASSQVEVLDADNRVVEVTVDRSPKPLVDRGPDGSAILPQGGHVTVPFEFSPWGHKSPFAVRGAPELTFAGSCLWDRPPSKMAAAAGEPEQTTSVVIGASFTFSDPWARGCENSLEVEVTLKKRGSADTVSIRNAGIQEPDGGRVYFGPTVVANLSEAGETFTHSFRVSPPVLPGSNPEGKGIWKLFGDVEIRLANGSFLVTSLEALGMRLEAEISLFDDFGNLVSTTTESKPLLLNVIDPSSEGGAGRASASSPLRALTEVSPRTETGKAKLLVEETSISRAAFAGLPVVGITRVAVLELEGISRIEIENFSSGFQGMASGVGHRWPSGPFGVSLEVGDAIEIHHAVDVPEQATHFSVQPQITLRVVPGDADSGQEMVSGYLYGGDPDRPASEDEVRLVLVFRKPPWNVGEYIDLTMFLTLRNPRQISEVAARDCQVFGTSATWTIFGEEVTLSQETPIRKMGAVMQALHARTGSTLDASCELVIRYQDGASRRILRSDPSPLAVHYEGFTVDARSGAATRDAAVASHRFDFEVDQHSLLPNRLGQGIYHLTVLGPLAAATVWGALLACALGGLLYVFRSSRWPGSFVAMAAGTQAAWGSLITFYGGTGIAVLGGATTLEFAPFPIVLWAFALANFFLAAVAVAGRRREGRPVPYLPFEPPPFLPLQRTVGRGRGWQKVRMKSQRKPQARPAKRASAKTRTR